MTIYREAYQGHPAGEGLRDRYPEQEAFEQAIPGLILAHNLYGIDIDLRAVQLTALSLYLRAKRAHPEAHIVRVNAIHAAPMPGDKELFDEFLASLGDEPHRELLRTLLVDIWRELDVLAGEAGSLLRFEVVVRRRIEELKERVDKASARQLGMTELLGPSYEQTELSIDSIPTGEFWNRIERRILELLRDYAERAETHGVARRLFAEDAHHGIAFLDALLQPHDVVLMNPPFGAASTPSKEYIERNYPRTKNDVYAAFVERGLQLIGSRACGNPWRRPSSLCRGRPPRDCLSRCVATAARCRADEPAVWGGEHTLEGIHREKLPTDEERCVRRVRGAWPSTDQAAGLLGGHYQSDRFFPHKFSEVA